MLQMVERMKQQVSDSLPLLQRISAAVVAGGEPSQDDLMDFLIKSSHSFDTIFVLGENGSEQYLLAHRDVLVSSCEYFRNMLGDGSSWAEARNGRKPFVVRKPNIEKNVFYHVLQFLYCMGFDGLDRENVLPLLFASAELSLSGLFNLCFGALMEHIVTDDNACEIFE